MANLKEYRCSNCDQVTDRKLLTVKKVLFLEMGVGARTLKSRVVGWLCPRCVARDGDFNLPSYEHQKGEHAKAS